MLPDVDRITNSVSSPSRTSSLDGNASTVVPMSSHAITRRSSIIGAKRSCAAMTVHPKPSASAWILPASAVRSRMRSGIGSGTIVPPMHQTACAHATHSGRLGPMTPTRVARPAPAPRRRAARTRAISNASAASNRVGPASRWNTTQPPPSRAAVSSRSTAVVTERTRLGRVCRVRPDVVPCHSTSSAAFRAR